MREVKKTVYESFDGRSFDTAAECRYHEKDNIHLALVGLTVEQVDAALTRNDKHLGDAIEAVATRIKHKRLADGDLKRERRKDGEVESAPVGTDEPSVESGPQTEDDWVSGLKGGVSGETSDTDLLSETVAD